MGGTWEAAYVQKSMPRAETCRSGYSTIPVAKAIELRDGSKKMPVEERRRYLDFRCCECGMPVRAHRGSKYHAAHFEHRARNPACRLSDPHR